MTPFSLSQGGPGRSQAPAVTQSYGKQPRNLGLREKRPSRFYGNERRGWPSTFLAGDRATELRKQEAKQRKGSAQHYREGLSARPAAARRSRVCNCSPTAQALRKESGEWEQRLRKAREAGTPTAAHPSPFLASQPGAARNFGGMEETSPQSRYTVSSEMRPFTFPAGMSGLLPSGVGGGDKVDDCRCSTRCFTNPGSGK